MVTHSNILAWRIPWTEQPGRLQSMGLQRVRHNWSNLAHSPVLTYGQHMRDMLYTAQFGASG